VSTGRELAASGLVSLLPVPHAPDHPHRIAPTQRRRKSLRSPRQDYQRGQGTNELRLTVRNGPGGGVDMYNPGGLAYMLELIQPSPDPEV
jgi:hypothetical protein